MALLQTLLTWLGIKKAEEEEKIKQPQNMTELLDSLPKSFHDYTASQQPYRHASAIAFILLCIVCGIPLWWHTTEVYRAPMGRIAKTRIPLDIRINLVPTNEKLRTHMSSIETTVLQKLNEGDTPASLQVNWTINTLGVRPLSSVEAEPPLHASDSLDVKIALVSADEWTHFSANYAFLSCGQWTMILVTEDDLTKTANRIGQLVWEVLVDVPHLESIVKRDLRDRMPPWQIATLPLSHQKRLVWDSAALSGEYLIQTIFLHNNNRVTKEELERSRQTVDNFWRFARFLKNVTKLQISSEHLWDFEISNFIEKDVQDRWTLSEFNMQNILKEVDMQVQTVEGSAPVLKMIVLESDVPIIVLDSQKDDSQGAAVADWGAVVSRNEQTDARLLAALRVLLGMDSDLIGGRLRGNCPLSAWEITRLRLRAYVDNRLRAVSAVNALHKMVEQVDYLVISDEVAALVNSAVDLLSRPSDAHNPNLEDVSIAKQKAEEALAHPSLLKFLYFPQDQKVAVYLPIVVPTMIPLLGSIYTLVKWVFYRFMTKKPKRE